MANGHGHQNQQTRPLQTVAPTGAAPPAQQPPNHAPPAAVNPAQVKASREPVPAEDDVEVHVSAREDDMPLDERRQLGEKLVEIRPRRTVTSMQIGHDDSGEPRWFSFTAGRRCTVPKSTIPHLEEKGII